MVVEMIGSTFHCTICSDLTTPGCYSRPRQSELDGFDKASAFTIADAAKLLKRASSKALKGWGVADQNLPDL